MDRASIQERFGIIGSSAAIYNVLDRIRQVSRADITVLIQGESGVGKELIAHAVHELSLRRHKPVVIVNCGAIPEGLIESELFGAEKGAYTGAVEKRSGYFEDADRGTIFLDEIGELPLAAQVRLLRVLENGEFTRVGSSTVRQADVRIIAATNKNLAREVELRRFREDLYYRLSTVIITIPSLRQRKEDILPILEVFLHQYSQKYTTPLKTLDESARQLLLQYHWPGNVRELRNVAEQTVVLLRGNTVTADDIRPFLRGVTARNMEGGLLPVMRGSEGDPSEARERELIYRALLELRLEVREMKEELSKFIARAGAVVPRELVDREDFSPSRSDLVIFRDPERDAYPPMIEDVPYEIENEEQRERLLGNGTSLSPSTQESDVNNELPTLEEVERDLITRALTMYDGNRRQTARALGISERTLYRKLKDMEEE